MLAGCMLVFMIVLQMGPRAFSSERARTNVGSSSQPFNRANFLGAKQEARYTELASRNICSERTFNINS